MKIACILPDSISEFREYGLKNYDKMMQMPLLELMLLELGHDVVCFDFLSAEGSEQKNILNGLRSYKADVWVVCVHFCLKDLKLFINSIFDGFSYKPFIICYGTGVLDWETALRIVSEINVVVPMVSIETVVDCIGVVNDSTSLDSVTGIAYRRVDDIIFSRRISNNFCEIIKKNPLEKCISAVNPKEAYLWGSCGCWYGKCTFCNVAAMQGNYEKAGWIGRAVNDVVQEMVELYKLGVRQIMFLDPEFIGPGEVGNERAKDFAKQLQGAGISLKFMFSCRADGVDKKLFSMLQQAGLDRVFLGIESGSPRALNLYEKGLTIKTIENAIHVLQELKIKFRCDLMLANPHSNLEEIFESLNFIKKMRLSSNLNMHGVGSIFHRLHMHAGTPLFDLFATEEDRIQGLEIENIFFDTHVAEFYEFAMRIDRYLDQCMQQFSKYKFTQVVSMGYVSYMKIVSLSILIGIVKDYIENADAHLLKERIYLKFKHLRELEQRYIERILV